MEEAAPFGEEGRVYVFYINGTLLQNLISPNPIRKGGFGSFIDIQDDMIVISEERAEVEDISESGRIHAYKLGAPKAHEPVEETSEKTEETTETDTNSEIPSYPLSSIGLAITLVSIILLSKQRNTQMRTLR